MTTAIRPTVWRRTDYGSLHIGDEILTPSDCIARVIAISFPPEGRPDDLVLHTSLGEYQGKLGTEVVRYSTVRYGTQHPKENHPA